MLVMTPDEIRKAEDSANENGLSYEDMMESAGMGCAEHILTGYPDAENIVIICGKGKNGGDGFVIARYLKEAEKNVKVLLAFNSPSDELSEKNKRRIEGTVELLDASRLTKRTAAIINDADVIVDAVFGIGFKGVLPENVKELFAAAARCGAKIVAVDVPSGLSIHSENTEGCLRADETLSMLCFKHEHIYKPYSGYCGRISVIPIGFGVINGNALQSVSEKEIKDLLPCRPFNSHKGTFGKALIIAGSKKMPGAGIIAAKGCLSTGAGLTYFAFPEGLYSTVTAHLTECVFRPLPEENGGFSEYSLESIVSELDGISAAAIGPGIGTDKGAQALVAQLVRSFRGKLIIDADGINIISRNIDILKESEAQIILTPHPQEMSRLTGIPVNEINASREKTAAEFAQRYGVTVLLKGANTVIASPDGKTFINPTGSSALSRGGSGDLLTGITVSLAAQGLNPLDAAVCAAYIHGLSGEKAEERFTSYCATTQRITDCIPEALSQIIKGK